LRARARLPAMRVLASRLPRWRAAWRSWTASDSSRIRPRRQRHPFRRLLAAVDRVLADARWTPRDLEGLAVSIGPGSFTGLRIGVSTVKGLGWALGLPIAAVPTLDAMAATCRGRRCPWCPVLDARRGEVYTSLYRHDGDGCAGVGLSCAAARELAARLGERPCCRRWRHRRRFAARAAPAGPRRVPSPACVAVLAASGCGSATPSAPPSWRRSTCDPPSGASASCGRDPVEPMRAGDLDEILVIERARSRCRGRAAPSSTNRAEPRGALPRRARRDAIVGYLCIWEIADEIHVTNIAIHPAHRRRGIARDLLSGLLADARARDLRMVVLECARAIIRRSRSTSPSPSA